ncbi:MAG: hypothetical protein HY909_18215 [Deltaproteobacteria bacterium]|nr:hypothetical protein [Deltaproteobacteria bacterium]
MSPRARRAALLALVAALFFLIPSGLPYFVGGTVDFAQGVRLTEAQVPRQAAPGDSATLRFRFQPSRPLQGNWWVFVHIEGTVGGQQNCRVVEDHPPSPPASQWGTQAVTHDVHVTFPSNCRPGRLEVLAGIYERDTGQRLALRSPRSFDNRLHVGALDIVPAPASPNPVTLRGSDLRRQENVALLDPWRPVLAALGVALLLALLARWRLGERETPEEPRLPRALRYGAPLVPVGLFVFGLFVVLEFVKDDAYISFRYAHNLVAGQGLVFNPGERLEGYTNFLWTLLMVPFEALGWDLFQVCEWLGTALVAVLLWRLTRAAVALHGERRDLSHLWGPLWLASSSSLTVWAKSGLEQPLSTLLPFTGAWLLWTASDGDARRRTLGAGLLLGLGCTTRPEVHLITALVGLPLLWDAARARRLTDPLKWYALGVLLPVVPFHVFRLTYYGDLLPNTFYVKTGTGDMIWRAGVRTLRDMFDFNHLAWLVALVPFAFLDDRRRREKLVMLAVVVGFMAYVVKVGVDEMHWHRLYLPALPFLVCLAACGARSLADAAVALLKAPRLPLALGLWALLGYGAWLNEVTTWMEYSGLNGHGDLAGTYHPDMGKFLTRHTRPGGLVAFQDMGSTPYHAPDLPFLDFIGLVDRTVARARHAHGLHAFVPLGDAAEEARYDAEMRAYFYQRSPEWAILTVYPPAHLQERIANNFLENPSPEALLDTYGNNGYQFGIWEDRRFHRDYVHVRTWPRSRGYYLSLFRRRDLWEQVPREVVLERPPADLRGARATLTQGVELLGSEVQAQTIERHEAFITTWWRAPGPLPADTTVFIHVDRPDYRATMDHPPGDWMYPADRWRAGDIVEDRVLFQLPIGMPPGTYNVFIGLYRRATGERLHVTSGANDGTDRIPLGTLSVRALRPVLDQLIPPTRVEVQRRYPERIPGGPR